MPLTFTDEQYPLFRNSFDARPTATTVAFETIDIQAHARRRFRVADRGRSESRGVKFNHAHAERNAVQEVRTTLHVPQLDIVGSLRGITSMGMV